MPIIISKPHICKSEVYTTKVPVGYNLIDLVDGLDLDNLYIELNGHKLNQFEVQFATLYENDTVVIINVPKGKGALQIIGTLVAVAAMIMGFYYVGPLAANALALTGNAALAAQAFTAAAMSVAATMTWNAFFPPPKLDDRKSLNDNSILPSITGTRNSLALWRPLSRLYGKYKFYPSLAARPYTELAGDDQYLRMLFCLGYGPLDIGGVTATRGTKLTQASGIAAGAIKIGDTDINSYSNVEYEIGDINQISLYTRNIVETSVGAALNLQATSGAEDTWWTDSISVTRATDINTTEVSLDLVFPNGLYELSGKGSSRVAIVEFTVSITDYNTGTEVVNETFQISGSTKRTKRVNKRWSVPEGQYNVKLTRNRTWIEDNEVIVTDCTWTVLRSIKPDTDPIFNDNGKNILFMALKIKATDQLQGTIDQLNIEATSILPVWDGTTWTNQATSNPAWIYYNQLTGEHVKKPVDSSKILLDDIKEWADFCDNLGLEFNYVFDNEQTQFERLSNIAAAGFGTWNYKDGYYGVLFDKDTSSNPVVQVITPRNARNFKSERVFKDVSHALRVRYVDSNADYEQDEVIVYRQGYDANTATRYETLDTLGISSQEQAIKMGQYAYAQTFKRPEVYTVDMDFESLAVTRGDVVLVSYDVIKTGLSWGRIKEINGTSITLDNVCYVDDTSKSYGLEIRKQDGSVQIYNIDSPTLGDNTTFTLTVASDASVGDLFIFGELSNLSIRCKVLGIDSHSDFSATLTLVDEAPDITDFTSELYVRQINNYLDYSRIVPPAPTISIGNSSQVFPDGSASPVVVISWTMNQPIPVTLSEVEIRYKETEDIDNVWVYKRSSYTSGCLFITELQDATNLDVQARVKTIYGTWSEWSDTTSGTVTIPISAKIPAQITNFTYTTENDYIVFTWDLLDDPSVDGYEIRQGTDWDTGTVLFQNLTTNKARWKPTSQGTFTFWIKAKNIYGNYSTDATSLSITIGQSSAPTDITVTPQLYGIDVNITYTPDAFFDSIELWASTLNDRSTATLLYSGHGHDFSLTNLNLVDNRYFWTRIKNIWGIYSDWYPVDQYGGIHGQTLTDPTKLLGTLQGSVSEDQLISELNSRIDQIDTNFLLEDDILEDGIVLEGLTGILDATNNNYTNISKAQIDITNLYQTTQENLSQIQSLQSDIASLTTSDWQSDVAYTLGRIVRYNNETWRCIQENTGIAPDDPANTDANGDYVYWEPTDALSTLVSQLDQRVDTLENEITTKVEQTDFDALSNTVSNHGTLIQQNSDAILLKADKTEVSALSDLLVDDFDSNKTYNKWDIVKYNGKAYQAIQDINFTPAPVPTNTDYWLDVGTISNEITSALSGVDINANNISIHSQAIVGDITLEDGIVEDGIIVESPADIHGLDTRITQANIDIDGLDAKIDLKASSLQGQIDGLDSRMTNAEIEIDGLNSTISLKADKTEVDNLETRVSSAETNITTLQTKDNSLQAQINDRVTIETYNSDQKDDQGNLRIAMAEQNISVLQTDTGDLKAQYYLKTDVNGYVAGFGLYNTGADSEFAILADRFKVANPSDTGETPKQVFIVGQIGGQSTVGIDGNLIVDGSISSNQVGTNLLITNEANIADAVITNAKITGVLQSSYTQPDGYPAWKLDKDGSAEFHGITIYDPNGVPIMTTDSVLWDKVSGTGKPENNADVTSNHASDIILYQATAPTSPTVGTLWGDTSSTPVILKRYNGTSWDEVSTLDGRWSGIVDDTGTKPEDNATVGAQANVNLKDAAGNLASDIIHPSNKITSSNIGLFIDTAAIQTAYIADAAITTAKINDAAIDSAKIADAAIQTAHIGEAQIDTLRVASGAITIAEGVSATDELLIGTSGATVLELSINIPYDGNILILSSCRGYNFNDALGGDGEYTLSIQLDGTTIFSSTDKSPSTISLSYVQSITSGSHIISMFVQSSTVNDLGNVSNRSLAAILLMR